MYMHMYAYTYTCKLTLIYTGIQINIPTHDYEYISVILMHTYPCEYPKSQGRPVWAMKAGWPRAMSLNSSVLWLPREGLSSKEPDRAWPVAAMGFCAAPGHQGTDYHLCDQPPGSN